MAISEQSVATSGKQLDQLCINTIRTLSMDAVQKANSGHPGTPMGLAPVAYSLWKKFLQLRSGRSPLAQPRPLRALLRPCVDAALFAAASGRRARSDVRRQNSFDACGAARSDQEFPPTGQQDAGPSRIWLDHRRRNDDRPARPGRRQQRRHGHRRALAGGAFQSARLRTVRLQHLRHLQRRRHDGRHFVRSRFASPAI